MELRRRRLDSLGDGVAQHSKQSELRMSFQLARSQLFDSSSVCQIFPQFQTRCRVCFERLATWVNRLATWVDRQPLVLSSLATGICSAWWPLPSQSWRVWPLLTMAATPPWSVWTLASCPCSWMLEGIGRTAVWQEAGTSSLEASWPSAEGFDACKDLLTSLLHGILHCFALLPCRCL